ncbi:hypothetical protein JCM19037_4031 [Geomicrobium sp. JCM 19037]|nr:hypothetical protein JCM19037_4031 [Geomicrobium sp. JCM 19037]
MEVRNKHDEKYKKRHPQSLFMNGGVAFVRCYLTWTSGGSIGRARSHGKILSALPAF